MLLLYNIIQETATRRAEMEQKQSSRGQTSVVPRTKRKFRELSVRSSGGPKWVISWRCSQQSTDLPREYRIWERLPLGFRGCGRSLPGWH